MWMASGSNDYSVRFWDLKSGKTQFTLNAHKDDGKSVIVYLVSVILNPLPSPLCGI
jgi:WD40 repeat protein